MSNLTEIFKNHKAFIPFVVADDPDFETTVDNIVALANGGADIVEVGIPFSDPIADGGVIQAADLEHLRPVSGPRRYLKLSKRPVNAQMCQLFS